MFQLQTKNILLNLEWSPEFGSYQFKFFRFFSLKDVLKTLSDLKFSKNSTFWLVSNFPFVLCKIFVTYLWLLLTKLNCTPIFYLNEEVAGSASWWNEVSVKNLKKLGSWKYFFLKIFRRVWISMIKIMEVWFKISWNTPSPLSRPSPLSKKRRKFDFFIKILL